MPKQPGSPGAQGSRDTPPARPCRCAVSGDAPPTPLSTPASGGAGPDETTPLCHLRANRAASSPEATPRAGAPGAGGASAAWRWGPGGAARRPGCGRCADCRAADCGGGREPGTESPRRDGTPFGTPRARQLSAARSSASGALWRRAQRSGHLTFRNRLRLGLGEGGGNFLGQAGASQRARDDTHFGGGCEEMNTFTWLLAVRNATAFLQSNLASSRKRHPFLYLANVY